MLYPSLLPHLSSLVGRGGGLESSTWRAKSSAKVTDSPAISGISSTAAGPKFSYMQILQKAQEMEGFN